MIRSLANYRNAPKPGRTGLMFNDRGTLCTVVSLIILLSTSARSLAETDDNQKSCVNHAQQRCAAEKPDEDQTGLRDIDFFMREGNRHARNKEYDLAVTAYTKAIRLDPKFYLAFINRARLYVAKGNYDRALEDFGEAIIGEETPVFSAPLRAQALNGRGWIFLQRAQYDRAIADFTAATQIDRISREGYKNRAEALFRQGKLREALADVDRALWVLPEFGEAYVMRSRIYREMGLVQEADGDNARASEIKALGATAIGVIQRSQFYPATSPTCGDGARHVLLLDIAAGKVVARPIYAGSDARISVHQSINKIIFRFGNEGCRIDLTIANSIKDESEPSSGAPWTMVPQTVEPSSFERVFYSHASHACAEAKIRVRVFWGYTELRNEYLAPGSDYSGIAGSLSRFGGDGCAIELRASRVD
jgi:tetratricopeptide (TPR) repeat protein